MSSGALLVRVTFWAELEMEVEHESFGDDWNDRVGSPSISMKVDQIQTSP